MSSSRKRHRISFSIDEYDERRLDWITQNTPSRTRNDAVRWALKQLYEAELKTQTDSARKEAELRRVKEGKPPLHVVAEEPVYKSLMEEI